MIRVFLSYSWDSPEHKQRVLELAQRLRNDGVDAWLDRFTPFPPEGWQRWMENEIEKAKFVLIVATEKYAERFAGRAPAGTGLGVNWEGAIITADLYDLGGRNEKFLPVIFSKQDDAHIPKPLRRYSRFLLDTDAGYTALYRLITGQPDIVPAPLGEQRKLPSVTTGPTLLALDIPPIHDHAAAHSNLPRLPYGFFGRESELDRIANSLAPNARTWGALIDGPGGIGKTALAIRAAELTPPGQFQRIIFLSAKKQELTPDGAKPLANFVVPGYLNMLNELARQLDRGEITQKTEDQRPRELQRALQDAGVLLIFDNLESLTPADRDKLFDFLAHLPGGCKAIVTSRRRDDVDARVVRLGKLGKEAALDFIAKLAEDREPLRRSTESQRLELYENTGGNPLLIRWVAGQLGRGNCRTVPAALALLRSAPPGNDPLEFIFGDLVDTFTDSETKVLAALSHFTSPMEVKFIAELAGLGTTAAQTALDDVTGRALVTGDEEGNRFVMMPLVADFLRHARPEAVNVAGNRLAERAYALVVENGYQQHERFPTLEAAWSTVAAALPFFLQGPNERLQTVCSALTHFLEFSGRWDESLSLELRAEEKAGAAKDLLNAGWRALMAGFVYRLRRQSQEVLACAERSSAHWREARADAHERANAIRLRAEGHRVAKDYPAAIAAYREAIELWRSLSPENLDVAIGLQALCTAELSAGKLADAERDCREALRIAKKVNHLETVATCTGDLAALALDREDWVNAEALVREALAFAEKVGRKEIIAFDCSELARALSRQGRKQEARPYAQRSVDIYAELCSPDLDWARDVLRECQS